MEIMRKPNACVLGGVVRPRRSAQNFLPDKAVAAQLFTFPKVIFKTPPSHGPFYIAANVGAPSTASPPGGAPERGAGWRRRTAPGSRHGPPAAQRASGSARGPALGPAPRPERFLFLSAALGPGATPSFSGAR